MKLQYFSQPAADADDDKLAMAKQMGHVPATCLLGGELVARAVGVGLKPCDGCKGPRARCKGTPEKTEVGFHAPDDLARIRQIMTGTSIDDPVKDLLRK